MLALSALVGWTNVLLETHRHALRAGGRLIEALATLDSISSKDGGGEKKRWECEVCSAGELSTLSAPDADKTRVLEQSTRAHISEVHTPDTLAA